MGRLRAADGPRPRAPRHPLLRDPRRAAGSGFRQPVRRVAMERLGQPGRVHLRGQPRRGLGGGRVLDRGLLARRPGRLAGHPPLLRVALPAGGEDHASRSTTAGCSRTRCPGCPRRRRPRASTRSATCAATARSRSRAATTPSTRPRSRSSTTPQVRGARGDGHEARASTGRTCRSPAGRTRSATMVDGVPRKGFNTPVAQARAVLGDARRMGLAEHATPTYARSHVHHSLIDHAARRVRAAADLPAADDDPLALGQRQVPQRALAHAPAARLPRGRRADRAGHRRRSRAWRPRSAGS